MHVFVVWNRSIGNDLAIEHVIIRVMVWVEYEKVWCDDKRFGKGVAHDRYGKFVNEWMNEWMNECVWGNGNENGNGNDSISEWNSLEPLTIRIKRLKLIDIVYYKKEQLKIIKNGILRYYCKWITRHIVSKWIYFFFPIPSNTHQNTS